MEDVALHNENSLKALVRAIRFSQGQFRLILARCNYGALRDAIVQRLRELCSVEMRELILPESVKSLYSAIKDELGDEIPCRGGAPVPALMVFGLESVSDIKAVLTSSNYIREEFSKHFPFPLVLWVNDEVLQKLLRLAPDLESWATSVEFKLTTDELLDFLRRKTDEIFAGDSTPHLENCFEVEVACQDLQHRGQGLEPDLEARLEFVRGLDDFRRDRIDEAIAHYQKSLALPNLGLERQGILLFNIALCYYRKAELNRAESRQCWEDSRNYFQQSLDAFEQAQRPDLVAKHINQLGEVLRRLKAWDELKSLAEKALTLHKTPGMERQLAQDYGFLAEVALEQSGWKEANELTQQALQLLPTIQNRQPHDWVLYTFLLARSQQHLGQVEEAIENLEQVRKNSNPQYDPQLYIDSLGELRSLYFQQCEYLKAFEIKRERRLIEYQYGFQAFAGASQLQPKQQLINSVSTPTGQQALVAREIAASGRERDVKCLIERISSTHHKLIVIHGKSGVGKSSIIQAGLVPALKQQAIGERDALPVLVRVYTHWVRELGRVLQEAVRETRLSPTLEPPQPPLLRGEQEKSQGESPPFEGGLGGSLDSLEAILEQLRKNADRNLVTVLIFDQFEEFFFAAREKTERRRFFEFLRKCLNIGFVKVILSLRKDYLHYLLESEQVIDLDAINNNILDKNIRYPLGNFSPEEAKAVIQCLTERSQFYLQPELIDALVRDLAGEEEEVRPIELQVVGAQLQADEIATLADYRQYGSKEKLVEKYLEAVIKDCGAENERAAQLVLFFLTDEKDTRPLKTRAELVTDFETADFASEVGKLDLVLLILVGSGLMLKVPDTPHERYQLVHDYLVSFIRQSQQAREVAERKKDKEERQRIEAELNQILKRRLRDAYIAGLGLVTLAAVAGVFGLRSFIGETNARLNSVNASSEALFASNNQQGALIESLKAVGQLKRTFKLWVESDTKTQVVATLQQAVYNQIVKELSSFKENDLPVWSLSWSPDGNTLVSGHDNGMIKLWNKDGKLIHTLEGHNLPVQSLSWSPDGNSLASAEGNTIKLWSKQGEQQFIFEEHQTSVESVTWNPDSNTIASIDAYGIIKLWSKQGKVLSTFKGHNTEVRSISWSPDGNTLASAGGDGIIKLWSKQGKVLPAWMRHDYAVRNLSWSPDGKTLASVDDDGIIKLWSKQGSELVTVKGHNAWVYSMSWSPDGKTLASASEDGSIKLWDGWGKELSILKGHDYEVRSLSWSRNGILASADADGIIKLWSKQSKELSILNGHKKQRVWSVDWSPDGSTIASGDANGIINIWSKGGKRPLEGGGGAVFSIRWSPDSNTLASASQGGTIKLWRKDGKLIHTLEGHDLPVWSLSWSPDGNILASASGDRTIKLWSQQSKEPVLTINGYNASVLSVSWSPDGNTIASAYADGSIKLWSKQGKELFTFKRQPTAVKSLSWSPDGNIIASAHEDSTIKLWNKQGEELFTLKGYNTDVRSVSWSPDGNTLASASQDGTIKLWSKQGKELYTLKGHNGAVSSVSWSPDGNILASASGDSTIILWNLNSESLLDLGCDWLKYYLSNNPDTLEELQVCQNKSIQPRNNSVGKERSASLVP